MPAELITSESITLPPEHPDQDDGALETLTDRRQSSVHLLSRCWDLQKQIRETTTYYRNWRDREEGDLKRRFLKDIFQELSALYDRGLASLSVEAHDKIVERCMELSTERRKVSALRWELADKTAELAKLENAIPARFAAGH